MKPVRRTTTSLLCLLCIVVLAGLAPAQAQQTQTPKPRAQAKPPAGQAETRRRPPNAPAPAAAETPARAETGASSARMPDFEPATAEELRAGYPLGIGDVVRVVIFQQPEMTTETRVSETGTITVPLLGAIPVGGVTARRAETRVAAVLRARGLVRDPQVVVNVLQFRSRPVSVLGLVQRPGRYNLEEGSYRLSDVLALAGGPMPESADVVTLVRFAQGKGTRHEIDIPSLFRSGDFASNPEVLPGDSIYVDRAPVFYIYGEVLRPGAYRLEKDLSVMQALALAGGLTLRGTEKNLQIRRRDAQGQYVFVKGGLSDIVRADDVVYIRESLF